MTTKALVEAALYSAGRPVSTEEIAERTGLAADIVGAALKALRRDYRRRDGGLEIARIGTKWTMQIRSDLVPEVEAFAKPELPVDVLKTAALIAYHQPIRQSDLATMLGDRVYEHVRTLTAMRLVTARPAGHTLELTTSRRFPAFFGIEATRREDIKRLLADQALGRGPTAPDDGRDVE